MKYVLCLLTMLLVSCLSVKLSENGRDKDGLYRICSIRSNDCFYYIDAQKNDSIFQIISARSFGKTNKDTIKVGQSYRLNLKKMVFDSTSVKKTDIKCSRFTNINQVCHYSLYTVENMDGLTLLSNDKKDDLSRNIIVAMPVVGDYVFSSDKNILVVLYLLR